MLVSPFIFYDKYTFILTFAMLKHWRNPDKGNKAVKCYHKSYKKEFMHHIKV